MGPFHLLAADSRPGANQETIEEPIPVLKSDPYQAIVLSSSGNSDFLQRYFALHMNIFYYWQAPKILKLE